MGYGGGNGGNYNTVGGGSAFGGSDDFELPSYNQAPAGSIRFNTDSKKLEVYILGSVGVGTLPNGIWMEVDSWSPDLMTGGTRAVFGAGINPSNVQTTDYINVSSTGNAINFGNLTQTGGAYRTACASRTKGVFFNAQNSTGVDKIIIASTGSAASFGAAPNDYNQCASVSNSVKGFRIGGSDAGVTYDNIYQIIFESEGQYVDFGNMVGGRLTFQGLNSSTRGVLAGGRSTPSTPTAMNNIDYFQMATQGNTADFGDLSTAKRGVMPSCNSVRGLFAGGSHPAPVSATYNTIEYVTIATLGNSIDFGDLVAVDTGDMNGNASSPTRGIFAGTSTNEIQYVEIMSTGNAVDFGNLSSSRSTLGACSNGHGGL
jgi:hypothetical protein